MGNMFEEVGWLITVRVTESAVSLDYVYRELIDSVILIFWDFWRLLQFHSSLTFQSSYSHESEFQHKSHMDYPVGIPCEMNTFIELSTLNAKGPDVATMGEIEELQFSLL